MLGVFFLYFLVYSRFIPLCVHVILHACLPLVDALLFALSPSFLHVFRFSSLWVPFIVDGRCLRSLSVAITARNQEPSSAKEAKRKAAERNR